MAISDADVVLRVDDNVTIKFVRNAIAYVAKVDGDGNK
jgi:preprotein translocase subunit YajC